MGSTASSRVLRQELQRLWTKMGEIHQEAAIQKAALSTSKKRIFSTEDMSVRFYTHHGKRRKLHKLPI